MTSRSKTKNDYELPTGQIQKILHAQTVLSGVAVKDLLAKRPEDEAKKIWMNWAEKSFDDWAKEMERDIARQD